MTENPERAGDPPADRPIALDSRADLEHLVQTTSPLLIEFYTTGCTLCQAIEPVLGTVAKASAVTVATINPRDDLGLVDEYDIRSVPTLILFVDGVAVDRLAAGFVGAEEILDLIEEHVPESVPNDVDDGD